MLPSLPSGRFVPPWAAALALLAAMAALIVLGHEGRRSMQVLLLALPVLLWLRLPLSQRRWRTARWWAVTATTTMFALDACIRIYLLRTYQAQPDSSLVLSAAANTNARETAEYLSTQTHLLILWGVALLAGAGLFGWLGARAGHHQAPITRTWRWLLVALLILGSVGYLSKPWRRHHPIAFWPSWVQSVEGLRLAWSDQQVQRDQLKANARGAAPHLTSTAPATVVLVLTESVNRDNLSAYGYARPTTPELSALQRAEGAHLLTVRHAWSTQASTLPSLSGIFSFGVRDEDDPAGSAQHLLALAHSAGYRIWWMSNHDDVAVEQQHARLADDIEMNNRRPGRSGIALDGELLDNLAAALKDDAPRKLIVVHMLGVHPHYRLRMPAGEHPFDDGKDEVDASMIRAGRPVWLREFRQDYDGALRYHDKVVAETLRLTEAHAPKGGDSAWMFMSDHGQEVGHTIEHAGHSPGTPAGYRIPLMIWRNNRSFDAAQAQRPFRADWAGWTLADLMHLQWTGMQPERNVLDPRYAWEAPQLPVKGVRFDQ